MWRRVLVGLVMVGWMLAAAGAEAQTAAAQTGSSPQASLQSVAGRYEGTATTEYGPSTVTGDLRVSDGVLTGSLASSFGPLTVTGGSLTGEAIVLNVDMDGRAGTVSGLFRGGKIEGQWALGADSGSFSMAKVAETAAAPAAGAAASGADPLTGDWNAVMDVAGNQRAFTISMKLDGEKVTGQIGSEQGSVPLDGGWANGTLTLSVSLPNGAFTMTGTFDEAKLVGTFSFGDAQFTGGWAAERRK